MRIKKQKIKASLSLVLTVFVLLPLIYGCFGSVDSLENGDVNAVIAVVNGEKISAGKLMNELKLVKRKYKVQNQEQFAVEESFWLKTKALNQLIQTLLFKQEAGKHNIRVDEQEFQRELQRIKKNYREDSFQRIFEMEDIDREDWEDRLKNSLLIKNLINKVVNSKVSVVDEELAEYFEEHPEEFHKTEQVKALHIMVATEEEAQNILKQLKSRRVKFSDLAKEYSLGPEGGEGGNLGYFEAGQMPEEFDSVFKLKKQKVSDVIRTPYGFHVFKVVDKKAERKMNFEESKKLIRGKLLQQRQEEAFREWMKHIKDQANIEIQHENFARIK